jgi:hypothetical protein
MESNNNFILKRKRSEDNEKDHPKLKYPTKTRPRNVASRRPRYDINQIWRKSKEKVSYDVKQNVLGPMLSRLAKIQQIKSEIAKKAREENFKSSNKSKRNFGLNDQYYYLKRLRPTLNTYYPEIKNSDWDKLWLTENDTTNGEEEMFKAFYKAKDAKKYTKKQVLKPTRHKEAIFKNDYFTFVGPTDEDIELTKITGYVPPPKKTLKNMKPTKYTRKAWRVASAKNKQRKN